MSYQTRALTSLQHGLKSLDATADVRVNSEIRVGLVTFGSLQRRKKSNTDEHDDFLL